jgi:tetratricopeptide (TPR) repeat protein
MASFQHLQGRPDDAERAWQVIATAARQARDPAATAGARLRLAAATCGQGRHAEARPIVDQCVTAFDDLGDKHALAAAHYWRAVCEWNLEFYVDAQRSAELTIQDAQNINDQQIEMLALRLLALSVSQADIRDQREDAVAPAEQALKLARRLREPAFEQEILHTVAHVYNRAGLYEDALRLCQDGVAMARSLGVQTAMAEWLGVIGDAHYGLGRYHEAVESLRTALPTYRNHFMHRHHGLCLLKMGYAYQATGDYQAAIGHLSESLGIFGQLRLDHYTERARQALGTCESRQRAAHGEGSASSEPSGRT